MARGRASNGSGMQPRQRKDGRWEVRFISGYDMGNGKPIIKSLYGKTAAEVAEKLRAATAAVDAGTYIEPQRMPLKEWLDIWLKDYCGAIKPGTLKAYSDCVRIHIVPALGASPLCELQPHHVQRFINSLRNKQLSEKHMRNIHGVLSKALSEAVRIKYLASNPAAGCILPKAAQVEIHPFEAEEISAFMEGIKGNPSEALFFVALNTGMRLSEILGLRWTRVDFKKGLIKVDAQMLVKRGKDGKRQLGPPKSNKARTFKPAPAVIDCLRMIEHQQKEWRLKAGPAWTNPNGLVFTDEIGEGIPHNTVEHRFKHVLQVEGIEAHRFHDLRHTFTVESLRAGVDVKTVSEMLGHASVSFTLDVYGHVTKAMQDEAANKLQAVILGRK